MTMADERRVMVHDLDPLAIMMLNDDMMIDEFKWSPRVDHAKSNPNGPCLTLSRPS